MSDAAELAAEAIRLASAEPNRATALADHARAAAEGDPGVLADAARASGLAARHAQDLTGSLRWLRRSVELARRAGDRRRHADALISLSFTQALLGRTRQSLLSLDEAEAVAPEDQHHALGQRALILMRAGRFDDALPAYDRAIAAARASGGRDVESTFLNNRALLHCWRGRTDLAEADLVRAGELSESIDDHYGVAAAGHNLGWVLGRRGDVPAALAAMDRAEDDYRRIGVAAESLLVDRAELLLGARLVAEALDTAERAVRDLQRARAHADAAVARVLLSEAQLLAGRPADARRTAGLARRAFLRDGRTAWAALARAAEARARVAERPGAPTAAIHDAVLGAAGELDAAGWQLPALDARLTAAGIAFARGDLATGAASVQAARRARHSGPVELRVRAWHAEALGRLATGDRKGALAALARGLRIVGEHRASLGATELRAHVGAHGDVLARLGVRLALEDGRPSAVLAWSEHQRAQSLRFRPVRPPEEPGLAAALAALRAVAADVDDAIQSGDDVRTLVARQAELEREVSRLTRRTGVGGDASGDPTGWGPRSMADVRGVLDERPAVLVSYVLSGDALAAVVVDHRRTTLHDLGSAPTLTAEVDRIAFALRRLARPGLPTASATAAREALGRAGDTLDELLIAPLAARLGDGALVLVPTGPLHGLAWAALPSLRARDLAIVPSAAILVDTVRRGRPGGGWQPVVAVAGPGLEEADAEAAAIAALHPGASLLDARSSSAARVLERIDGAGLAHLATHGRFRGDNPLFSSLVVADGPLLVHDLTRLSTPPGAVILSACDSGASTNAGGDELIGMAAVLFASGTRAVVASSVPVPDAATRRLMETLHGSLAAGQSLAPALTAARRRALASDADDDLVAGVAFGAFGDVLAPS